MKEKVVILVTHQIQYLKEADQILVLQQGKITHQGNYDSIIKSCEDISSFVTEEKESEDEIKLGQSGFEVKINDEKTNKCEKESSEENETNTLMPEEISLKPQKIEETAKIGSVSRNVYLGYIKAGATLCTGFVLTISIIGKVTYT